VPHVRSVSASFGLLVAVLLCAPARAQDGKLELRLRLKQGETYRVRTTVDQRINQTTGPNQQATEQTIGLGYSVAVKEVDGAGNMKVTTRYDSILFRQKGPSGAVEYDSQAEGKQVPPAAKAFAALTGLEYGATLTPTGQVKAVEGLDAMLAEMVRKLELPDGPTKAAVQKVLAEQFGEDAMKRNVQSLFALYPEQPVAVGDSWQRKVVVTRGFPVIIEGAYTLKGRQDGIATVEVKAALSPNEAAGAVDLGTGKMSYDLKGEQSGTVQIEESTGWTRSLATEQLVSGTIRFQGAGGAAEVTSPITIQEKVTLEAVK
jgi:hypothetical protein